jgi:hypothetical protein
MIPAANLAMLSAHLGTLSEDELHVLLSSLPLATAIISTRVAVHFTSSHNYVQYRSSPNPPVNRLLSAAMVPTYPHKLASTDHLRGAASQRTSPLATSSRHETITPGSMPCYQPPGYPARPMMIHQPPVSPARPMLIP